MAGADPDQLESHLQPLFEAVVRSLPGPSVDPDAPAQLLVTNLTYDDYKGKIVLGRLSAGALRRGLAIARIDREGEQHAERIAHLFLHEGLERV